MKELEVVFDRRLCPWVLNGTKLHTITTPKGIRPLTVLNLFQDSPRRLLGRALVAKIVFIRLELGDFRVDSTSPGGRDPEARFDLAIWLGGRYLDEKQIVDLVFNEGFRNRAGTAVDLVSFVQYFRANAGLCREKPFHGELIAWKVPIMHG